MSRAVERRAARERALGLLYEAEVKGVGGGDVLAELPVAPDHLTAALVALVDERRDEVDALLTRFSERWPLHRMPAIDRAALRMGSAELLGDDEVPTAVVLAETVQLASRFSTDASGRFVNGLLARVAREVRGAPVEDVVEAVVEDVVPVGAAATAAAAPHVSGSAPDVPLPVRRVDALVTDLDGVIRHWEPGAIREAEERLGLSAGALAGAAFDPERFVPAMDGRLAFEDWCREIGDELARRHGIDADHGAEAWAGTSWRIDLDVIDLVEQVRRGGTPVALLSNASTRLVADLERSGISDAFDAVVGSADIGVVKPQPEAYRAAAEALGVPVERCAFVDDTEENVESARVLGMEAVRFDGVTALREWLRGLGLIAPGAP